MNRRHCTRDASLCMSLSLFLFLSLTVPLLFPVHFFAFTFPISFAPFSSCSSLAFFRFWLFAFYYILSHVLFWFFASSRFFVCMCCCCRRYCETHYTNFLLNRLICWLWSFLLFARCFILNRRRNEKHTTENQVEKAACFIVAVAFRTYSYFGFYSWWEISCVLRVLCALCACLIECVQITWYCVDLNGIFFHLFYL